MSDHGHDDHHEHAHTSTVGYLIVFGLLLLFTLLTWYTAVFVDLGETGNIALALLIACTKASLVLYFFMHLREAPKIIKVTGIAGFFFVGIMLLYFVTDFKARGNFDVPEGEPWEATDAELVNEYELIQGPPKHGH